MEKDGIKVVNSVENNSGFLTKNKLVINFKVDITDEEVVKYKKDHKATLKFVGASWRELGPEALSELNKQEIFEYAIARQEHAALQKEALRKASGYKDIEIVQSPLTGSSQDLLKGVAAKIKSKKPESTVVFKRPDEVDSAKVFGYNQETVATRFRGEPDLIAMTIPTDVHQKHLAAVANKSRRRTHDNNANVISKASRYTAGGVDLTKSNMDSKG